MHTRLRKCELCAYGYTRGRVCAYGYIRFVTYVVYGTNVLTRPRAHASTHAVLQQDNAHWYLACINFKAKRTEVYDSMGGERDWWLLVLV